MLNLRVVKIGGRAVADAGWLADVVARIAASGRPTVVVHGGGPEVTELSRQLGVPVSWHQGRRITTPEALRVATMVLSGWTNKRVVGALLDGGVEAVGLSGEDGALFLAEVVEGGKLGRVGRIVHVRTELIERLLGMGFVPVISPISRGVDGQPLNVNADDAAAAVAGALGAAELLFLTDVDGVHDGVGERAVLTLAEAATLIDSGVARDGMAVKLDAAAAALAAGVRSIRIGPPGLLDGTAAGTTLVQEAEAVA
ncbi:MAG: acetylglutamate kinase [bacterium]|nr:MAG: acetylglutamate kinase [bacterium]